MGLLIFYICEKQCLHRSSNMTQNFVHKIAKFKIADIDFTKSIQAFAWHTCVDGYTICLLNVFVPVYFIAAS